MKRVFLFLATNVAVMVVLSIIVSVFGLDQWLTAEGIDYTSLLCLSAMFGFGGAFISLLHVQVDGQDGPPARRSSTAPKARRSSGWSRRCSKLAEKAGIGMPEVAIFEGAPNAFATGAFKQLGAGRGVHRPAADA